MRTCCIALVAFVGLAAGCGSAPDCNKTVAKAADSMRIHDPADVKGLTELCAKGWSGEQRQCVADAKDLAHVAACVPDLVNYEAMQAEKAALAAKQAEALAAEAVKDAQAAKDKVEKIQVDVQALDQKVAAAVDAVVSAQNDADRTAAKAKLEALRKEKADLEAQMAAANAAAARAERLKGVKISKECQDNPLAKGCQ